MKTATFRRIPAILTVTGFSALLLLGLSAAQAQPNPDNPERRRPPANERPRADRPEARAQAPGSPQMMEQVLNFEQRESLREAMQSQRAQMRGLQEKIRAARQALYRAALGETYDESAVRARAQELAQLEAGMLVLRVEALADVRPLLTKAQIEQIINPPLPRVMREADERRPPRGARNEGNPPRPPKPESP